MSLSNPDITNGELTFCGADSLFQVHKRVAQHKALKNLDLKIGRVGVHVSNVSDRRIPMLSRLTVRSGLVPSASLLVVPEDFTYLVVTNLGTPSGQGFDFGNSYTFLERFHSVYDSVHSRIGFPRLRNRCYHQLVQWTPAQ